MRDQLESLRRENAELRVRALGESLLLRATAMAAATDSVEEALRHCIEMVCEYAGWPIGHVYLFDEGEGNLYPSNIWYMADGEEHANFRSATMRTRFEPGVGLPGRILSSGRPAWIVDVHRDDNFLRTRYEIPIGVRAAFGFPLRFEDRTVAVLEFFSEDTMPPDEALLRLVQSLGEQIGRVLERRDAERKIHESEERFRRLAENIEEIHWMREPGSGLLLYLNPAFGRMTGTEPPPGVPHPDCFLPVVREEDRAGFLEAHRRMDADGGVLVYRTKPTGGAARWIRETVVPIRDPDGELACIAGIMTDITESKSIEIELRALSRGMIEGQESERTRVARELHDGVIQILSTAKGWVLDAEEKSRDGIGIGEEIDRIRGVLDACIAEIRAISRRLHPSILDDIGLAAAATSLCEEFERGTGIAVLIRARPGSVRLGAPVELALYRILQEALTNVQRHSGASGVQVELTWDADRATLVVADDGRGFDAGRREREAGSGAARGAGLGLSSIAERARAVEGKARFSSPPTGGVRVEVIVALTGNAEDIPESPEVTAS